MKNNIKILTIMCLSMSLMAADKRPAEDAPTPPVRRLRRADNPVLIPMTPEQINAILRDVRAFNAERQARREFQARIFAEAERQRRADQPGPLTGPSPEEMAALDTRFAEVSARSAALRRAETHTPHVDPQQELPEMRAVRRLFFGNNQ